MPRLYRERRSVTGGPGSCVPRSTDGEHALVTSLLVGHPCAVGVGRDCHASAHVVLRRRQLVHRYWICLFQHRQHRLSPSAQHRTTQNEWQPTHGPHQVEAMMRPPVSGTFRGLRRGTTRGNRGVVGSHADDRQMGRLTRKIWPVLLGTERAGAEFCGNPSGTELCVGLFRCRGTLHLSKRAPPGFWGLRRKTSTMIGPTIGIRARKYEAPLRFVS